MAFVSNASRGGSTSSGAVTRIFDSTLAAPGASLDTGAGGIPGTYSALDIWAVVRTADAGATGQLNTLINADAGANYDIQSLIGNNVTASSSQSLAQNAIGLTVHGNGGAANYPSTLRIWIPAYAQTTFFKNLHVMAGLLDTTAANGRTNSILVTWRSTAAITRIGMSVNGGANLLAGSRLTVYGIT